MKKRLLSLCLALVMVSSLMAGCAKETTTTETTEATESTETTTETTETEEETTTEEEVPATETEEEITLTWVGAGWSTNNKATNIIAKWEAEHPNVKVDYVEMGTAVDTSYLTNLDTMVAGGEVVDITYLGYSDVYTRAQNGGAMALDAYIADAGDNFEEMYGSVSATLLEYDGSVYGVPFAGNTYKVFYNKTLTDAAGIEIPAVWSIEEFQAAAETMNDPANDFYGCILPSNWTDLLVAHAELSGFTYVVEKDGELVPNFDNEVFKDTMAWARGLADSGVSPSLATITAESLNRRQALMEGTTAMIIDGPYTLVWMQGYMYNDPAIGDLPFELGVADIPYVTEEATNVSYNTVAGAFYVPKSSAHPQEAYEFAKFICNECSEECSNYMPNYTGADMSVATKSFTQYTDVNGELHENVFPQEVAEAAVAVPNESFQGYYDYDPTLASEYSLMYTVLSEQIGLYLNGEMEMDEWIELLMQLGEAELAFAS